MNKLKKFLNIHVLFLLVFLLLCGAIVYRLTHWGSRIDQNDIVADETIENTDTLDFILPALDEDDNIIRNVKNPTILLLGNAPFADDRSSEDSLAQMIADRSGGTVFNCAVEGSYLASKSYAFDPHEAPMDAYCLYWMVTLLCNGSDYFYYEQAEEALGDNVPEGAKEAYETLTHIDMNEVDVLTIMYDATDYLMGHEMYDDSNPTNIETFTGNLEASIELLQFYYPHLRIIVLSPTYAFAVDEKGQYISSDMYTYGGHDVFSTYVIRQAQSCDSRGVSFVDNLYGTITEDNATEYLVDNLHLTVAGRELVADRFLSALRYYDN